VTTSPGWSLRTRVNRSIIGVLVLLMALVAIVAYAIAQAKETGDDLVDQWDPAYTISQNLLTAMVNEETGVRGYALAGDPALLEPYNLYSLLEDGAQGTLRKYLLEDPDLLQLFYAQRDAIEAWHAEVGDPVIEQVQAGDPSAAEFASSPAAKLAFDDVRDTSAALTNAIYLRRTEVATAVYS